MRIAWTGSSVGDISSGSVAVLAGQLLWELLERGVEVDFYNTGSRDQVPERFAAHPNLRVETEPVHWSWNRWYSSNRALAFVSSLIARATTQARLSARLIRNHRRRHYDCIFQFSQTELLVLGVVTRLLPPIVVQPSTTAAGELEWHRRESRYARRHEKLVPHYTARAFLTLRATVQRRQLRKVRYVVGASEAFLASIREHYGLPPDRLRLLPHPIDIDHYAGIQRPGHADGHPIVLLFASRLSARKGLEMVIELSHRLADLAPSVKIVILSGASMWSDYTGHVEERHPEVAQFLRARDAGAMRDLYARVYIVLTPSHWEPFSLVTAEALAAGVPVVVSDAIGAAEGVDRAVCRVFPAGDTDAFEREVRELVAELRANGTAERLADVARNEARTHFSAPEIGGELERILRDAAG
jgi:glycosyltransferase involved in cell wall biosynthesis